MASGLVSINGSKPKYTTYPFIPAPRNMIPNKILAECNSTFFMKSLRFINKVLSSYSIYEYCDNNSINDIENHSVGEKNYPH